MRGQLVLGIILPRFSGTGRSLVVQSCVSLCAHVSESF